MDEQDEELGGKAGAISRYYAKSLTQARPSYPPPSAHRLSLQKKKFSTYLLGDMNYISLILGIRPVIDVVDDSLCKGTLYTVPRAFCTAPGKPIHNRKIWRGWLT